MNIYLDMIGCRLNQSEIEIMARQFSAAGHTLVGDPADADLAVVNTCTVTGSAAADSRKTIRRIARSGVERIISTGCWSSMHPDQALKLPGVTRVVSNLEKDNLVVDLLSLDQDVFDLEPIERVPIPGARQRTRGFIKVQDGCRHSCTFCITTIARGNSYSLTPESVLREIQAACQSGVQEVVLTGVQLGSWGKDLAPVLELSDLVKHILSETGIPRLRLSSLEPWDVSRELIDLLRDDRVARHLHLPLQSGSTTVMRRMGRAITPDRYKELIQLIKKQIPGVAVTTDLLTGFPGETDSEFQENLDFIREMDFADGHVFTFSPRQGTEAFEYPDQVPHPVRKERSALIREVIKKSNLDFRQKHLDAELDVLWERSEMVSEKNWIVIGLTDNYIRVEAKAEMDLWNRFSGVRITDITSTGVRAEII